MKRITVDYVMSRRPCYKRRKVEAMFNGRKWVTPLTVLNEAKQEDAFWLLMWGDFMAPEQMRSFAKACADHVAHLDNRYSRLAAAAERGVESAWAARQAAWAEGWTPAWSAEREWQINKLKEYFK